MAVPDLLESALESNEAFVARFRAALQSEGLSVSAFSERSGIPQSTLYHVMAGKDFRVSTLRDIHRFLLGERRQDDGFVAVVSSIGVLHSLTARTWRFQGRDHPLRDYPAATIEDAIVKAIEAERDGAVGIVCGPIAAATIQQVVDVPVATIQLKEEGIQDALQSLANQMESGHRLVPDPPEKEIMT